MSVYQVCIMLVWLKLFLQCNEGITAIISRLQTQYRDDPIFIDALLKIIGAVNRGIQKYNDQMRIQSDIIQNGKLIIEKFMSFPMGQNGQSDVYTLDFIYSFLWVLKSDTTVLVSVMRYLLNLINSVTTFYKYDCYSLLRLVVMKRVKQL